MTRNYCVVDGCNSKKDKSNSELSFFTLPKEDERRKEWLTAINRPDLLTAKPTCHIVCSLHFDKSAIKYIPHLNSDAVPTKVLPNITQTDSEHKDMSTQTNETGDNILSAITIKEPDTQSESVQTPSIITKNEAAQTTQAISSDTPRKSKLRGEYKECEKKRRKMQHE